MAQPLVLRAKKSNLVPSASRFIGRVAELERLRELFDDGARLVTVFGPAGTGKTRLVEAFGTHSHGQDWTPERGAGGGAWICELVGVRDAEGLCGALGRTLDVPPAPAAAGAIARLGDAIAGRGPILIILDNAEHVIEATAQCVAAWLTAAPDARFLLTSREPLRVAGEVRLELGPLPLPEAGRPPAKSEAVQLFLDRVGLVEPSFALRDDNGHKVADLVRRLDGIPLALELAASRFELFGLDGLLENLDQRLNVLTRANRDAADRHATLRAAIGWSWDLLDQPEREMLSECAVFRGGFSPDAALAVLAAQDRDVLTVLQSLRDKSLLRRYQPQGPGARPRFALYESVRAYAREQSQPRPELAARHSAYYLEVGQAWADGTAGPDAVACLASLEQERDNLLAVHRRALAPDGRHDDAVRCALVLDAIGSVRGSLASHLALLEETLETARQSGLPPDLEARATRARGKTRMLLGQLGAAGADFDRALELVQEDAEPGLAAEVWVELGVSRHHQRSISSAAEAYDHALEAARAASDRGLEGRVLGNLGALNHDQGRFDDARTYYRDALTLLQQAGNSRLEAIHVANLGILEQERGELARARGHFEAAQELLEAIEDRRLLALVAGNLGNLEHEEGRPSEARRCHETALRFLREVGDRRSEALCLGRLGRTNATLAWLDDARSCLAAADRILGRFPDPVGEAAVALDRGFVDVALARQAAARGSEDDLRSHVDAARGRLERAKQWADRSDDIRTAMRILDKQLSNATSPEAGLVDDGRPALVIGPDARWMQPPEGDPQDLRRRKALRLILLALVRRHSEDPGAGVDIDGLLAVGWPGERVVPTAGANRVYVALTTLRKLGLRGHLLSRDGGYLLDPAVPVEHSATEWASLQG